jgi:SAM-dependent methyltransferase
MNALHKYTDEFFEYIEMGSSQSAKQFCGFLVPLLRVTSVLDVGCGRGAWLREWKNAGVKTAQGVDGPYVQEGSLLIPVQDFTAIDLSKQFDLLQRYDLVTSLEVAEHLPPTSSEAFVASLTRHADLVLFSAATPGQGGENHINERPLAFWQRLFATRGYEAYDIVRPAFSSSKGVEPWYRFNTVLYANERVRSSLPKAVTSTRVNPERLTEVGDIGWRIRKSLFRVLPNSTVTTLSRWNYRRLNRAHKRRTSKLASNKR